ncbi:hypothetical protein GCM10009863_48650 [Streptomyces axinellae]|uniref:Uncharacterized protein n=1 Tax=Streptomyces axinellae TaxID=552788 RepID=A0ABP6CYY6_9ACTN
MITASEITMSRTACAPRFLSAATPPSSLMPVGAPREGPPPGRTETRLTAVHRYAQPYGDPAPHPPSVGRSGTAPTRPLGAPVRARTAFRSYVGTPAHSAPAR